MRLKEALKLREGDKVIVRKTNAIMSVLETESVTADQTSNNVAAVSIMLDDGNWYGYKTLKTYESKKPR